MHFITKKNQNAVNTHLNNVLSNQGYIYYNEIIYSIFHCNKRESLFINYRSNVINLYEFSAYEQIMMMYVYMK